MKNSPRQGSDARAVMWGGILAVVLLAIAGLAYDAEAREFQVRDISVLPAVSATGCVGTPNTY